MASAAGGKKRVVILGSGYAGAKCAGKIQDTLGDAVDLTVIDRRKANVHKIGAARAAVVGVNYSDRVLIPNENLVRSGLGKMVNGAVAKVTEHEVIMDDGNSIPFDYLVCATGSTNFSICEPPLRYAERDGMKKFYERVHKKIRAAERILIVGGGPTGVELAGEIKYEYHSKVVTIVHSGPRLLSNLRPQLKKGFEKRIRNRLDEIGVVVITGQKVLIDWKQHGNKPYISTSGTQYKTDKGRPVDADLVLLCAGFKVTNQIYPKEWLNDMTGQMQVKRSLQLLNHNHIFCAGDLNDIPENKQAVFAGKQGELVATNIKKLVEGRRKMKKYSPGFGFNRTFIFISVGRNKGASHMGFFSVGSYWTRKMKCKDLFVKDQWKVYNLGDQVPNEVGGPSKGNKLGTVSKPPNLMAQEGGVYNIATRSIEMRPDSINNGVTGDNRVNSIQSTATLADMYDDDDDVGHNSLSSTATGMLQGDGGGTRSLLKPMTEGELNNNRTMERSKKKPSQNPSNQFNQVPMPTKGGKGGILNQVALPNAKGKPKRDDIISFVGAGPVNPGE